MSLIQLLGVSGVSVGAHRSASATASNNLNNINTPGYARQRAAIQQAASTLLGGVRVGGGAVAGNVTQVRDPLVESRVGPAFSESAFAEGRANALTAVSMLDPAAAGGLQEALSGFFGAWRQLAQNSGNGPMRSAALGATSQLATAFNRTSADLVRARRGADAQLGGVAQQVNDAARTVARLNGQIRAAGAGGAAPPELLDARQAALDTLSTLTGARALAQDNGDLMVSLPDGTALVSGTRAASVSLLSNPSNSGLGDLQVTRTDGSGARVLPGAAWGGQAGGLLSARDGALKDALASLDTLAADVAGAVNTVHTAGNGLDGVAGRSLLDTQGATAGAASRLRVHADVAGNPSALAAAQSATTLPGGGDNALALVALESASLASGATPNGALSSLVGTFGSAASAALSDVESTGVTRSMVTALREAASGVSSDEETVALIQAQRAFEASLKVISTADQMLETLLQLR